MKPLLLLPFESRLQQAIKRNSCEITLVIEIPYIYIVLKMLLQYLCVSKFPLVRELYITHIIYND